MASLAAYIESQDWLAVVPEDTPGRADLAHLLDRMPGRYRNILFDIAVARSVVLPKVSPIAPGPLFRPGEDHGRRLAGEEDSRRFAAEFRKALHALLCSADAKAEEGRASILKEAKVGQTSVAVTIAATLAPVLGTGAATIAGAVAVALAIISRVSLSAWCAMQSTEQGATGDRSSDRREDRADEDRTGDEDPRP
ncbi:hypothetical protein [Pseudonocardia cypriaca]|uniref:hypothetical protein n=1 Tax=Pseudonocardia cypriaca TaxID=882449 RepID=UPI00114E9680|nr:hypothetical protein [Pseudonocardia cypriaca]